MSTARVILADQIKADNPEYVVKNYPAPAPDNATKPHVFVYRTSLAPSQNNLEHELEIAIFTGTTVLSSDSEERLGAVLDQVILSIERINGFLWTRADRVEDGYKVSVQVVSQNHYKNIVREEQKGL